MTPPCSTVVLPEARISAARGSWRGGQHEHPEAQVTVRLPPPGRAVAFRPSARIIPHHAPHQAGPSYEAASVIFHFTADSLGAAAGELHGTSRVELRAGNASDAVLISLAEAAWEEMSWRAEPTLMLDSLAHLLAARLVRAYANIPPGRPRRPAPLTSRQLATLKEFFEVRIDAACTVREAAASIGLGPQRLSASLKNCTGFTPHRYLTHLRVTRAARLLKRSRLSLVEIAFTLGFASQSHFGQVFRRFMGVTPQAYRRQAGRYHSE